MSNPASMSIVAILSPAHPDARPKQREPRQLGARSSLERKRLRRVCVPGGMERHGFCWSCKSTVRRAAAQEDKTLAYISAITTWIIHFRTAGRIPEGPGEIDALRAAPNSCASRLARA